MISVYYYMPQLTNNKVKSGMANKPVQKYSLLKTLLKKKCVNYLYRTLNVKGKFGCVCVLYVVYRDQASLEVIGLRKNIFSYIYLVYFVCLSSVQSVSPLLRNIAV